MNNLIYILQPMEIELAMPDGSVEPFTLEAPNGSDNPFWYRIIKQVPGGNAIYKDPLRRKHAAKAFYVPEFHFNYGHHRMFLTSLLAAIKIELITGWKDWRIACLLKNNEAVKNYLEGFPATGGPGSNPNPVPSGSLDLVLVGKERQSWLSILQYFFYFLPGIKLVRCDSTLITCDSTEVKIA